ncbi:hypothetical protein NHQ30_005435 [Ciborinia camelliae]|nr:hypothetical protein NHQ30_005435 [Ciborinia camelliae]
MQFTKICGVTAALLISIISASPIALTSDFIHPSGPVHMKPTGSIDDHSFKIHPTGSFNPKEPIPICTGEEKPKFTIHPTGSKAEHHHFHPSGTGIKSHKDPKPTGHVSKPHESGHAKPTGHLPKRTIESDIIEGTTMSKTHKTKPTGSAIYGHESGYAKPTGFGNKKHHHPSGTGVYESGHAKPTGKGGKEHHNGHAKPTGVYSQKPVFTGIYESKSFEFKTETLTFGSRTFTVTGVVPEETGRPHTFEEEPRN